MPKKNTKRKLVGLVSEVSGVRQYYTTYNPQNEQQKNGKTTLKELRKYDPEVRRHVTFKVTKKNLGRNEVKPRKG